MVGALGAAAGAQGGSGPAPVGPGAFAVPGVSVVTFGEVPVGTTTPFTIAGATFGGLGALVTDPLGGLADPPSISGGPLLYSMSVGNDDAIEVNFARAQRMVGAYFNILGDPTLSGQIVLEFYNGDSLLGVLPAVPIPGTFGGFIGGDAGAAVITRVIFRDTDTSAPVSFRIDDLMFVPAPGAAGVLVLLGAAAFRRRR
ncbi:MAG: hypothetical protein JNJ48_04630 [Phycisphaerae bacterium]|nr:hypothetical protein [Phycisphaerae bacterium]